MELKQIHNLLAFTLIFHKICKGSSFSDSDISYIEEKYNKLIGVDVKNHNLDSLKFSHFSGGYYYEKVPLINFTQKDDYIYRADGTIEKTDILKICPFDMKYVWFRKWKYIDMLKQQNNNYRLISTLNEKQESIVNYLCIINTISIVGVEHILKIKLDSLIDIFNSTIGDVKMICKNDCKPLIHPILYKLIDSYLKNQRREVNLITLDV